MEKYIKRLISEGEHQRLDFKYCISDSRKIARTLSAFSNSDGGKLLIGVRDNGKIAGVRSEEEYYMIDAAAAIFCKPEVSISVKQHLCDGKTVLEVDVPKGDKAPYMAKSEDGKWKAYFRHKDQNLVAGRIMLEYWRRSKGKKGVLIRYGEAEKILLEHLREKEMITFSGFRKLARISPYKAERIIVNLLICDVLRMDFSTEGIRFRFSPQGFKGQVK